MVSEIQDAKSSVKNLFYKFRTVYFIKTKNVASLFSIINNINFLTTREA